MVAVAVFGRVRASVTRMMATALAAATMTGVTAVTAPAASAGTLQVFGWGLNTAGQVAGTPGTVFLSPAPLPLNAAGVRQVDIGESNSALVMADGTVDTWGDNFDGALGDGTRNDHYFPAPVPGLSGIRQVSIGEGSDYHGVMLAVDASGTVWGWGTNNSGVLGCPCDPGSIKISPVAVPGLSGVTQVVSGNNHALALDRSGLVWAWGWNDHGQLGDGTTTSRSTPEPVPGLSGIVQVAASVDSSFALRSDGVLFVWGEASDALLASGGPSQDIWRPMALPGPAGVTQVAVTNNDVLEIAGPSHAVWAWGSNRFGEVGNGTDGVPVTSPVQLPLTGAVQVSGGLFNSAAVLSDGTLWVWGNNTRGELGLGARTADIVTPRLVTWLAPVSQVALGEAGNGLAIASASSSYVTVPDVRGDDLATATTVLERARLRVGTVTYVGVCSKPGLVVDQAPEAVVSGIVTMRPVLSGVSLTIGRHVDFCP